MIWEPIAHFVPPREDRRVWGQPGGCSACQDPTNPEQVEGFGTGRPTSEKQKSLLPLAWQPGGSGRAVQEGGAWPSPQSQQELHLVLLRGFGMLPVPDPEPWQGRAVMGWRFPIPAKLGCCSCHGNVGGLRAGARSPPL